MLEIILNGNVYQAQSEDLNGLLKELKLEAGKVAVALNRTFISKGDYIKHRLAQNDQIEIVAPMAGG
jgi:sulfur carrier protein